MKARKPKGKFQEIILPQVLNSVGGRFYAWMYVRSGGSGKYTFSFDSLSAELKLKKTKLYDWLRRAIAQGFIRGMYSVGNTHTVYLRAMDKVAVQMGLEASDISGIRLPKDVFSYRSTRQFSVQAAAYLKQEQSFYQAAEAAKVDGKKRLSNFRDAAFGTYNNCQPKGQGTTKRSQLRLLKGSVHAGARQDTISRVSGSSVSTVGKVLKGRSVAVCIETDTFGRTGGSLGSFSFRDKGGTFKVLPNFYADLNVDMATGCRLRMNVKLKNESGYKPSHGFSKRKGKLASKRTFLSVEGTKISSSLLKAYEI